MRKGNVQWRIAAALSVISFIPRCSRQPATRAEAASDRSESELARPVKTMVVAAQDKTQVRSFPGKVQASKRVDLAFQVPGLLVKLPVREGQKVAEGDMIAQLRQDEF